MGGDKLLIKVNVPATSLDTNFPTIVCPILMEKKVSSWFDLHHYCINRTTYMLPAFRLNTECHMEQTNWDTPVNRQTSPVDEP